MYGNSRALSQVIIIAMRLLVQYNWTRSGEVIGSIDIPLWKKGHKHININIKYQVRRKVKVQASHTIQLPDHYLTLCITQNHVAVAVTGHLPTRHLPTGHLPTIFIMRALTHWKLTHRRSTHRTLTHQDTYPLDSPSIIPKYGSHNNKGISSWMTTK